MIGGKHVGIAGLEGFGSAPQSWHNIPVWHFAGLRREGDGDWGRLGEREGAMHGGSTTELKTPTNWHNVTL